MDKGTLTFDVKTGMKNIIGRDLITDDFIAIYELVKNSYDAYASHVKIFFGKNEITISDNGKGMSKADLEQKWFAVAYSAKKEGTEDSDVRGDYHLNNLKSRRFYAGAKGVGRFSCDRLGNELKIFTSKVKTDETYRIDISWKKFEVNAQHSFNSIKIPFEQVEQDKIFPNDSLNGTILRISDLNTTWDKKKIFELRRSLEKLIKPFSEENSFQIEIQTTSAIPTLKKNDEKLNVNGKIGNSILSILDLKTTQIDLNLEGDLITTRIIDRGTLIYDIEEPNNFKSLIDNLSINLYFLNRSAKINFGKIMDIEPKNYGSIFLFKNGFRVQPYGNTKDDSWRIDYRKQQGYNRFLGTRDLFGRVELITENFNEFKEVSSRDGGLVETEGKKILFDIFYEKALRRLERYVVGVLWGEAFKRKKYFLDNKIADKYRNSLLDDKDKDTYEDVLQNAGSKIDFVDLIKTLSDDENIKIIKYNKELVSLVNEKLEEVQFKFISYLEKIAEKTNDEELLKQVKITEENFNRILKEKEEAIIREEEERKKRIEAEKRAEDEKKKREEEEQKRREAEDEKRKAELEIVKKEKERALAELAKLKAEQKAKEEEEKRGKEEKARKEAEKREKNLKKTNKYLLSVGKELSTEAIGLVHHISYKLSQTTPQLDSLIRAISRNKFDKNLALKKIYNIKLNTSQIEKVSRLIIRSNFNLLVAEEQSDLIAYIEEYVSLHQEINELLNVEITIEKQIKEFTFLFSKINISIIIDDLISNAKKANATKAKITFSSGQKNSLQMIFSDNGKGVNEEIEASMFEIGITSTIGSGVGLFNVKKLMKEMRGSVKFIGNDVILSGANFQLTF
ncbi:MAG: ATP-binding protein [Aureispira sp.]